MGVPVAEIYEAARTAGQQLVQAGEMATQVLATVSRELVPPETYIEAVNAHFQQALDEL